MSNLEIYNKVKTPPKEALKEIKAGRLKGKTDISPQWRIEAMTSLFGICGIGWKYVITKQWTENASNNQIFAFTNVELYIKLGDKWSEAIPSNGGSMLIAAEKTGMYSNDEAFKMSLTDALGNAMKYIGVAADVYMGKANNGGENTKYDIQQENVDSKMWLNFKTDAYNKVIAAIQSGNYSISDVEKKYKLSNEVKEALTTYIP